MCLPKLKVKQCAFAETSSSILTDVRKCLDSLQMAPSYLRQQTASSELLYDWLVRLGIDLTTFCDTWSSKQS